MISKMMTAQTADMIAPMSLAALVGFSANCDAPEHDERFSHALASAAL